jgi:hypothetical protein
MSCGPVITQHVAKAARLRAAGGVAQDGRRRIDAVVSAEAIDARVAAVSALDDTLDR